MGLFHVDLAAIKAVDHGARSLARPEAWHANLARNRAVRAVHRLIDFFFIGDDVEKQLAFGKPLYGQFHACTRPFYTGNPARAFRRVSRRDRLTTEHTRGWRNFYHLRQPKRGHLPRFDNAEAYHQRTPSRDRHACAGC